MDFLANENFPLSSIRLLRDAGHDVASVSEDSSGAKDIVVLRRAHEEKRIILTFDRDYGELIYRYKFIIPPRVIYFRFGPSTPDQPSNTLLNILENTNVTILGKFTVIERGRLRQRKLRE
jgi:predicted nuclease of predicted toxin-antitoxin system